VRVTYGTRAISGAEYKRLAVKATTNGGAVAITDDVPLADLNGGETKTLLS
jgi:hypothetical protein